MNLERFDWLFILCIAVVSMLIQQAFSYVCQIATVSYTHLTLPPRDLV